MNVEELMAKYPKQLAHGVSVDKGWVPLIDDLCKELIAAGVEFEAVQIKEKFGGLRFYTDWAEHMSDELAGKAYDIIGKYEDKSYCVCEVCGLPGSLRSGGWVRTLCNLHAEDRKPSCPGDSVDHVCRRPWNTCSACNLPSCSACSWACYECVDAWKHKECAKSHADDSKHAGNINDLSYIVALLDHSPHSDAMRSVRGG